MTSHEPERPQSVPAGGLLLGLGEVGDAVVDLQVDPDNLRVVEDGEGEHRERMREEADEVRDAQPQPVPAPPPITDFETVRVRRCRASR